MWLPYEFYERLPVHYMLAGTVCLVAGGERPVTLVSAVLLFLAAAWVVRMRWKWRYAVVKRVRKTRSGRGGIRSLDDVDSLY